MQRFVYIDLIKNGPGYSGLDMAMWKVDQLATEGKFICQVVRKGREKVLHLQLVIKLISQLHFCQVKADYRQRVWYGSSFLVRSIGTRLCRGRLTAEGGCAVIFIQVLSYNNRLTTYEYLQLGLDTAVLTSWTSTSGIVCVLLGGNVNKLRSLFALRLGQERKQREEFLATTS